MVHVVNEDQDAENAVLAQMSPPPMRLSKTPKDKSTLKKLTPIKVLPIQHLRPERSARETAMDAIAARETALTVIQRLKLAQALKLQAIKQHTPAGLRELRVKVILKPGSLSPKLVITRKPQAASKPPMQMHKITETLLAWINMHLLLAQLLMQARAHPPLTPCPKSAITICPFKI